MNPNNPMDPPQQQPGPGTYPPQDQSGNQAQGTNPQQQGAAHTLYSPPYNQPYGQPQTPSQAPGSATGPGGALVQQPEIYNSPSLAAVPYGNQPASQPQAVAGGPGNSQYVGKKGPNKLVIIIIAGVVLLLVLVIIAVVASSGKKSADNQANQAQQIDPSQLESLQPAQSIDLEEANNAISQDMSSLDDESDFPADSLEDDTLGL